MKTSKITLSLILTLAMVISTVAFIPVTSVQASGAAGTTYTELNQPIKTWDMSTFAGVPSSGDFYDKNYSRASYDNESGLRIEACLGADISFENGKLVYNASTAEAKGVAFTTSDLSLFDVVAGQIYTMEIPLRINKASDNVISNNSWFGAIKFHSRFTDLYWGSGGSSSSVTSTIIDGNGSFTANVDHDNDGADNTSYWSTYASGKAGEQGKLNTMYIVYECKESKAVEITAYVNDIMIYKNKTTQSNIDNSTGDLVRLYVELGKANGSCTYEFDDIKLYAGDIKSTTKLQLTPSLEYSSVPETGTNTVTFTSSNASSPVFSLAEVYTGVSITTDGRMSIGTDAAPGIVKVKVADTSVSPYSTIYKFPIKPGIAYTEANVLKTWDMGSFEDVQATENTYDTVHKYKRLNYTNADGLVVEAIKDAEITFNDGKLVYTHNAENPSDLAIGITTNSQTLFNVTDGDTYTIAIPFKFARNEGNTASADNWFSRITLTSLCSNAFWTSGGENSKISNGVIETDGGYGLTSGTAWNGRGILSNEKEATIYIEYMCGADKNMTANMYINDIAIGSSALSADGVGQSEGEVTRLHMAIPKRLISGENKYDYTLEIGDIKLYEGNVKSLSAGIQTYTIDVENNTASPKTVVLYGASYEGNTLTSVDLDSKEISAFNKATFTVDVTVTANDTKLAYFLWENGTLTPITGFKPVNRVK